EKPSSLLPTQPTPSGNGPPRVEIGVPVADRGTGEGDDQPEHHPNHDRLNGRPHHLTLEADQRHDDLTVDQAQGQHPDHTEDVAVEDGGSRLTVTRTTLEPWPRPESAQGHEGDEEDHT